MKRRIRLTEGMLHRMIKEAINELDWKTYASAAEKQPRGYSRNYNANGGIGNHFRDEVEKIFQNKLKQLGLSSRELYKRDFNTWSRLNDEAKEEVLAKERKMWDRRSRFNDAARKAFDRDFGFEDETGKVNSTYGVWDGGSIQIYPQMLDSNGNRNGSPKYFITDQDFWGQNGSHKPGKWCVGTVGWAGAYAASPDFETEEEAEAYANEHHMSIKVVEPSKELKAAYQKASKEAADFDTRSPSGLREPSNYEYVKGKGWKLKNDSLDESIHRAIRRVLR